MNREAPKAPRFIDLLPDPPSSPGPRLAVVVFSLFWSAFLRFYQLVFSPLLRLLTGAGCRFYPSCSEYAMQAVRLHGPARGVVMTVKRLGCCHPFHAGGYDPPVHRS